MLVRAILCPLANVLILAIPTLAAAMEQPSVVASGEPRVELIGHEHIVVLPKPMKKALDRFNPKFTVWRERDYCSWYAKECTTRQTPFAVIGDFNGDGVLDVALHGHDEHRGLIVTVLSKDGKFVVVPIDKGGVTDPREDGEWEENKKVCEGLTFYLRLLKGPVQFPAYVYNDELPPSEQVGPLDLRTDGVMLGISDKGGVLYYWDGRVFRTYPLGC
ncbi:MAG: hypothetical protein E6J59_00585 [Deltaproteobacteria bacterium]|nr:MAG: hypothetical protein E6J59_00585 [Deltaproteobacteria bacterium]